ncbi:MAG: hypothetical protein P4L77_11135 [Sulfuriferula sp.]|nr:hypothetical protein [Sulfuriferula sp.]
MVAQVNIKINVVGYKVACTQLASEPPVIGDEDKEYDFEEAGWHGNLYRRTETLPKKLKHPDGSRNYAVDWTVQEDDPAIIVFTVYEEAVAEVDRLIALTKLRENAEDGEIVYTRELYEGLRLKDEHSADFRYRFFVEPIVEISHLYQQDFSYEYARWKPWPEENEDV